MKTPDSATDIYFVSDIFFSLPITYYSIFLPKFAHTIHYKKAFISEKE